ncbi:Fc.00g106930.m01.CDS01 [Cosmosporella sp. VM-42]
MPRKNRTPASLTLNRENQRKSRARHREFLNELQQRVAEYEGRDAQATLEMQRVARAVAEENEALREMLSMKGVQRGEVEEFVARRRYRIAAEASTAKLRESSPGLQRQPTITTRPQNPPTPPPITRPENEQPQVQTDAQPQAVTQETCACTNQSPADEDFSPMAPIDPSCYCPADLPQAPTPPSDGMPCLEAASILAQLRGHPDSRVARAALGCSVMSDCVIRNTDLLQLVDEMC